VRVLGAASTVEALRALTIPTGGGRYVRWRRSPTSAAARGEQRSFARLDGMPVVGFQVAKTKAASDIAVEDRVEERSSSSRRRTPTSGSRRSSRRRRHPQQLPRHHPRAARGHGAGRPGGVRLPAELAGDGDHRHGHAAGPDPDLRLHGDAGFSLNVITLLALTLVIGILVDDAIVEIENIEKRIERGQTPVARRVRGRRRHRPGGDRDHRGDHRGVPARPPSCPGIAGMFFKEFGLTVAVAVLFSLVVARL
jgi:HAE1 family hydrophobic/amphiphilic exporter-1